MSINPDPIPISKRGSGQMSLIRVKIPNGFGGLLEHELVVTNPDAIDILNHGDINGYSYSQRDHALIPIPAKPTTEGDEVEMEPFEDDIREVELDRRGERKGHLEAACDKVIGTNEALAELRAKLVGPSKYVPVPEFPKPMSILEEADHIINGERAVSYGDAAASFQQIADFWTVYVNRAIKDGKVELSALDVDNMMILMKVSRAQNGFHRDSYVDICGYAALTPKIATSAPTGPEKS